MGLLSRKNTDDRLESYLRAKGRIEARALHNIFLLETYRLAQ